MTALLAPEKLTAPRRPPIEQSEDGVWHVSGFPEARQIMQMNVKQAGFQADLVLDRPGNMVRPVLWVDGEEHREDRKQVARFFAPTAVHHHHVPLLEAHVDRILEGFVKAGRGNLCEMSHQIALGVVAELVGLIDSSRPGMDVRIDRILHEASNFDMNLKGFLRFLYIQWRVFEFWRYDVRPAIKIRKVTPKEDVISHLLQKNTHIIAIIGECITYAVAGMATTREFIPISLWHCLKRPDLREIMLSDDAQARERLLYEIVRLEPIIAMLYRRAVEDLEVDCEGQKVTIPAGALIDFDVRAINTDGRILGADACELRPDREEQKGIPFSMFAFGSGPHHCAGEFLAITESDIFLRKLLALEGLHIEREPRQLYNKVVQGYEVRDFIISLNGSS